LADLPNRIERMSGFLLETFLFAQPTIYLLFIKRIDVVLEYFCLNSA